MQADAAGSGMTEPAYFERQSRQLCLQHTINNLFQRRAVSAAELDALASGLPGGSRWWGPHRTLWLGNYGVSVLELAFAKLGKVRCSPAGHVLLCSGTGAASERTQTRTVS